MRGVMQGWHDWDDVRTPPGPSQPRTCSRDDTADRMGRRRRRPRRRRACIRFAGRAS